MGKKENIIALKSLFSMVVALISVMGIAVTLFSYFIISPALVEMNSSLVEMASTLVNLNDGLVLFESDINNIKTNQIDVAKNNLESMTQSRDGIKSARESIEEIEKVGKYGLSSQLISLKTAEDELSSAIYDSEISYENMINVQESDLFTPKLSTNLLKMVNVLDVSIKSFSTMFTALTIIALILFSVMILISIENLL